MSSDINTPLVRVVENGAIVTKSLTQLLDLISTAEGAVIRRTTDGWSAVPDDALGGGGGGGSSSEASPSGNSLISGGGVTLVGDLTIVVAAASYMIAGALYASPQVELTATVADGSNPRFDVVVVDDTGVASLITGTPAANPVKPDVDPTSQLELTFFSVGASATALETQVVDVYRENTEDTMSQVGGHVNLASTSNPNAGTVCVEATEMVANDYFQAASTTRDFGDYDTLSFALRNKAAWPSNKQISISARMNGTQVGTSVTVKNSTFGLNTQSQFTDYQQVVIPASLFNANGRDVNQIRFTCLGSGASIGFYVDDITLQGGLAPTADSTRLRMRGVWSTNLFYNANDVVKRNGIPYVALGANIGVDPELSVEFWISLVDDVGGGVDPAGSTAGQVLTSTGPSTDPTFQDNAGASSELLDDIVDFLPTASEALTYSSAGDTNGAIYFIGTNYNAEAYSNPHTSGQIQLVAGRNIDSGTLAGYVDRAGSAGGPYQNGDAIGAFLFVDLGANRSIVPNKYTWRHWNQNAYAPRNWKLQGTNAVITNTVVDINAATWTDLDVRTSDTTITVANQHVGFDVTGVSTSYRYLRVLAVNPHAEGGFNLFMMVEFDVYGTLSYQPTPAASGRMHFNGTDVQTLADVATTTLTGTQNNFSLSRAQTLMCNNATPLTITGLVPSFDGQEVRIFAIGAGTVTIAHEAGTSTAANRIITHGGVDTLIMPSAHAELVYDGASDRWRLARDGTHPVGSTSGQILTSTGPTSAPTYQDAVAAPTTLPTTWNNASIASGTEWHWMTYGNGVFVAVQETPGGSSFAISNDGRIWTNVTSSARQYKDICFGDGKFYACSDDAASEIAISSNGINWDYVPTGAASGYHKISYARGMLFAMVESSTTYQYSMDGGYTWSTAVLDGGGARGGKVVYANGYFVLVAYQASGNVKYCSRSTDGITWTQHNAAFGNGHEYLVYGAGLWVAVASYTWNSGHGTTAHRIAYSADGTTWTSVASPIGSELQNICYANGLFIVTGGRNHGTKTQVGYSRDGITWGTITVPSKVWTGVAYGNGTWVICSRGATPNNVIWSGVSIEAPGDGSNVVQDKFTGSLVSTRFKSVQSALTYAATTNLDFSSFGTRSLALTGNVTFTTSNLAAGIRLDVVVTAAAIRTLTFPATWVWHSAIPTSLDASKTGRLDLYSSGTTDAGVIASWTVNDNNTVLQSQVFN